jgi:hypothetical protein
MSKIILACVGAVVSLGGAFVAGEAWTLNQLTVLPVLLLVICSIVLTGLAGYFVVRNSINQ